MAEQRTPRSEESRENETRTSDAWTPASVLPVPAQKDGWVMSDISSRFEGNIEVGGLLLCKAPKEEMDKRAAYYQQMASSQMESVDNSFMRENDPRMPLLKPDRTTRTQFGKG